MKLTDIIELAKQGYKPSDIRELLKIETETEPQQHPEHEQPAEDPAPAEPEKPAEDPAPAEPKQPAEDPQPEPEQEPDYKALYEEEKAKRQALARKQEVAADETKSVEDTLLDIAQMYI